MSDQNKKETFSTETHSFNVDIAKKYGIEEAIFINHFAFWIKHNTTNKKNLFD